MKTAIANNSGQALILCLLLAGAAALASLLLFNSGLLANTKTQLQNAADAGAYSGAVMLARDHNFSAYANRAMVANQVAVAQLVSLESYLEDAANTRNRMNNRVQSDQARIPVTPGAWEIAKMSPIQITTVYNAYRAIAPTAVQSIDKLIHAFAEAQRTHHTVTAENVMLIVDEVVKKNDPEAGVSTGAFQLGTTLAQRDRWRDQYTKQYSANDSSAAADRFANVVVSEQSTDAFTRDRRSSPLPSWRSVPKPSYCKGGRPFYTSFSFEHRGGTILSSDKKRWLALDATLGSGRYICIYMVGKVPVPVPRRLRDPSSTGSGGSGGAVAGRGGDYADRYGFSGNPRPTRLYGNALREVRAPAEARYRSGPGTSLDAAGGLQPTYRDIADFLNLPANQSPELNGGQMPITVEVERGQASVRTSSTFLGGATNIRLDPQMKGASMRTLSSAHAFFYRPNQNSSAFTRTGWKRADGRTEMANLFNPYWQARLRDRTEGERDASFGAQN